MVAQRIEEVGGAFSRPTGRQHARPGGRGAPDRRRPRARRCIAEGVLEPAFRPETLGIERDAQLAGLREENDDVVAFARRLLRRKFFGEHPFALSAQGDEPGVAATAVAGPGRALEAAARRPRRRPRRRGRLRSRTRLLPKLEAFLAQLPAGKPIGAGPLVRRVRAEPGDFVEKQPREQAVVLQGFPGAPCSTRADFYAGEVADELFSGMASRLFERVRDQKGLAYFVRSGRACRAGARPCSISSPEPSRARRARCWRRSALEIARVQAGDVAAEELRRCQVRLKAGRRKALQTNSSRAMQAAVDVLQGRLGEPLEEATTP